MFESFDQLVKKMDDDFTSGVSRNNPGSTSDKLSTIEFNLLNTVVFSSPMTPRSRSVVKELVNITLLNKYMQWITSFKCSNEMYIEPLMKTINLLRSPEFNNMLGDYDRKRCISLFIEEIRNELMYLIRRIDRLIGLECITEEEISSLESTRTFLLDQLNINPNLKRDEYIAQAGDEALGDWDAPLLSDSLPEEFTSTFFPVRVRAFQVQKNPIESLSIMIARSLDSHISPRVNTMMALLDPEIKSRFGENQKRHFEQCVNLISGAFINELSYLARRIGVVIMRQDTPEEIKTKLTVAYDETRKIIFNFRIEDAQQYQKAEAFFQEIDQALKMDETVLLQNPSVSMF